MGADFWEIIKASSGIPPFSKINCIKLGKYYSKKIKNHDQTIQAIGCMQKSKTQTELQISKMEELIQAQADYIKTLEQRLEQV